MSSERGFGCNLVMKDRRFSGPAARIRLLGGVSRFHSDRCSLLVRVAVKQVTVASVDGLLRDSVYSGLDSVWVRCQTSAWLLRKSLTLMAGTWSAGPLLFDQRCCVASGVSGFSSLIA